VIFAALAAIVIVAAAIFFTTRRSTTVAPSSPEPTATSSPTQSADRNAPLPAAAGTSAAGASQVVNRVLPEPSRSALNTIHGTIKIRVKVDVDSSGNVTHAGFVTSGPSQYFARLAMQAAQQWKFAPAASPTESTLVFAFNRRGVEASIQPSHSH
jgi:TonB family protein